MLDQDTKPTTQKYDRLAAAMRENLRRRKQAQAKAKPAPSNAQEGTK